MEIDYNYLNSLLTEVNELRKQIKFCEIDITDCSISYMPKKKHPLSDSKKGTAIFLTEMKKV